MNRPRDKRWAPKYAQVMADIVGRIRRGDWSVGKSIPSLSELTGIYPCNRLTIHKALKQLARDGYLSIEHGRGTFVKQRNAPKLVGMLLGDDILSPRTTPFCPLLAKAAQDYFHEHGYQLKYYVEHPHLIQSGVPNPDLVHDIEAHALGGLVTAGSNAPLALAHAAFWKKHHLPHVDISVHKTASHRVSGDQEAMIELGLDLIRQRKRQRVAVIGFSSDMPGEGESFIRQATANGLRTTKRWLPLQSAPAEESGYMAMRDLWQSREKPDALIILDDIMAKGAVQAILQLGVAVPETLFVVSHANKGSGIFYPISMPKLELDPEACMKEAGALLLALMENPSLPARTVLIRPKLKLEESERRMAGVRTTMPATMAG